MPRWIIMSLAFLTLAAAASLAQPADPKGGQPASGATAGGDAASGGAEPGQAARDGAAAPTNPGLVDHPPAGHPSVFKPGGDWPKAKDEDVNSLDAIIAAYYASTSGKTGEARDWLRFRSLFHPQARLIPARATGDGGAGAFFLSPDDYARDNDKYFTKSGFVDHEVARRTELYGNIAQVWSTYETKRSADDTKPYSRGIASIQLLKDGPRWWIVSVFWDYERPDNRVPEKYLQSVKEQ